MSYTQLQEQALQGLIAEALPKSSAFVRSLVCQGTQDAALRRVEAHTSHQHAAVAFQDLSSAQHDRRTVGMLQYVITFACEVALIHPVPPQHHQRADDVQILMG